MKKMCLAIALFFSFSFIVYASEVDVSFHENFKDKQTINTKTEETIKVPIYFKTNNFKMYAILGTLEYDKDHLELIDYKEENDFVITLGERLLADRFSNEMASEGKIVTLNFKVKKEAESTLKFKEISVANLETELELSDIEITINSTMVNNSGNIVAIVSAGILIIGSVAFIMFKKNSERRKNKRS